MRKEYVKPEAVEVSFALADCVANGPDMDYELSIFNPNKLHVEEPAVFE